MVIETLKKHYPFTGNILDINGVDYHYLDEGAGDPVIMLHGNPSWSFYYRNLVIALRERYRCIVPDHVGCGFSAKPDDDGYDYTLSKRIDDLEQLLDHLNINQNITLVLHDWGGMIGMGYATRYPKQIKRLVIMNTAAFHLPPQKAFPLSLRICRYTILGTLLVRGFNAFSLGAPYVGCKRNQMSSELRRLYRLPYNSWKNRIATLRFVQDIPLNSTDRNYDLVSSIADGLEQFNNLPIIIIWGELDFVFDKYFLDEWKLRFPNARIHSYPDAGHYILEDMKDEVITLISTFIDNR